MCPKSTICAFSIVLGPVVDSGTHCTCVVNVCARALHERRGHYDFLARKGKKKCFLCSYTDPEHCILSLSSALVTLSHVRPIPDKKKLTTCYRFFFLVTKILGHYHSTALLPSIWAPIRIQWNSLSDLNMVGTERKKREKRKRERERERQPFFFFCMLDLSSFLLLLFVCGVLAWLFSLHYM